MQISVRCSVAVHCLLFIYEAGGKLKVTSRLLAQSTGSNPVVIRGILSALKKADLITVTRGTGGAELCKDPSDITLFMIYRAIEPKGGASLIGIHTCGDRECPIAKNICGVLQRSYRLIEDAVQQTMQKITLKSIIDDFHKRQECSFY